jgi:hypothetical protein
MYSRIVALIDRLDIDRVRLPKPIALRPETTTHLHDALYIHPVDSALAARTIFYSGELFVFTSYTFAIYLSANETAV